MTSEDANVYKEMTFRDLAKVASVSMATVSRSRNGSRIIPETARSFHTDELVRISQRRGA
jgi:hypothetical protein